MIEISRKELLVVTGLILVGGLVLFSHSIFAVNLDSANCKECHKKVDDEWSTSSHAEREIDCLACHKENKELREAKEKICISCHTTGEIKLGQKITTPQQEMRKGAGGFGIKRDSPSGMYLVGVPCTGCHMPNSKKHDFKIIMPKKAGKAYSDSCTSCHSIFQPQVMQQQIDKWQDRTDDFLVKVEQLLKKKKKKFNEQKLYQQAESNYRFVKKDGSKGVHNPDYTIKLLETAIQMLETLGKKEE